MFGKQAVILPGSPGKESLHHEYAVVHPDSKDESGYDDVDQIELQTKDSHDTLDDEPAQSHRDKGNHGKGDAAERQQQDNQHEDHRNVQNHIEIVVEHPDHVAGVVKRVNHNGSRAGGNGVTDGLLLLLGHQYRCENQVFPVGALLNEI